MPRNPFPTAPYYPQVPHPLLNNAAIYSRVDVETLFYVFYFLPVSYPQYVGVVLSHSRSKPIGVS
jgi:CCR4-NOT transcription complex subunit 3